MTNLVEKHFLHRGYGAEFDMEVEWLRRQLPRGNGPVLDVGCGIGALMAVLDPLRIIGVDYQLAGLTCAARRHPLANFICSDAAHLPIADGALEAITAQHAIEHLPSAAAALREWHRVLCAGGRLAIVTPNAAFVDPSVFDDDTHVQVFDHSELIRIVQWAGFEVSDIRTLGLPHWRRYQGWPAAWRGRRFLLRRARPLSSVPGLRWRGQTLCCAARRPFHS